jgi:hypothetical protein
MKQVDKKQVRQTTSGGLLFVLDGTSIGHRVPPSAAKASERAAPAGTASQDHE